MANAKERESYKSTHKKRMRVDWRTREPGITEKEAIRLQNSYSLSATAEGRLSYYCRLD